MELKCSRTAIWKQIQRLKAQGYQVEAIPRRGYRLISKPEKLTVVELIPYMKTNVLGRALHVYDSVESTQSTLTRLMEIGAKEGTVVVAEQQTQGRGRMGRKWHSPSGKGIWMSVLLKPAVPLAYAAQFTLLTSAAVCRAIRKQTSAAAYIKWPNDILIDKRKVCGILLESSAEDERLRYMIAGIGISCNLTIEDYPEALREIATSLYMATGYFVDRAPLIGAVLGELEGLYEIYKEQGFGPIRSLWEAHFGAMHQEVSIQSGTQLIQGIACGLDENGSLLVQLPNGEKTKVYTGEMFV
jgi:BirA family biotin operon repressor/biotin-[acetyl-CoA-carboxylase] ligase